jgi:hypothetical protein
MFFLPWWSDVNKVDVEGSGKPFWRAKTWAATTKKRIQREGLNCLS